MGRIWDRSRLIDGKTGCDGSIEEARRWTAVVGDAGKLRVEKGS